MLKNEDFCGFVLKISNRVSKWWRHKMFICEITSLTVIFRKIKIKNASMLKFSIVPPISDEILAWFCSDDLIQILIKIGLVPNVMNQAIGFVWSHWSVTVVISCWQFAPKILIFTKVTKFSFDLSNDFDKSHKFTNFNFCDVTHRHSIVKEKHKKTSNFQWDSNPWPLQYRCSALTNWTMKLQLGEQVHFSGSIKPIWSTTVIEIELVPGSQDLKVSFEGPRGELVSIPPPPPPQDNFYK